MNEVFEQLFNAACAALNVTNDNDSTPVNWSTVSETCRQEFISAACGFKGFDGIEPPPRPMLETEETLSKLEKFKYTVINPFYENYRIAKEQFRNGVTTHFQDLEGIVFVVDDRKGQWVTYEPLEVKRTRYAGEKQGGLSLTAARVLGYTVEGEREKPPKEKE